MTTSMTDAELRVEQDRLLREGRELHRAAVQVIPAAEKRALPRDVTDTVYPWKASVARADFLYGAARELQPRVDQAKALVSKMRAIADQALGIRRTEMLRQAAEMERLAGAIRQERERAVQLADSYQQKSKVQRAAFQREEAAWNARHGNEGFDYTDYLSLQREWAADNASFDWDMIDDD